MDVLLAMGDPHKQGAVMGASNLAAAGTKQMSIVRKDQACGVPFEVTNSPWFGPKQRGRSMLENSGRRKPEVSCTEFVSYIDQQFPYEVRQLEFVRFHSCDFREKGRTWPMRFAVCFTSPDFRTRQRLWEECPRITEATGWYPIVMGHRIKHERPINPPAQIAASVLAQRLVNRRFGKFQSIQSLSQSRIRSEDGQPKSGCSLILEFEFCTVLLDFNFAFEPSRLARKPQFAILTHSHQDHSGGMLGVLESGVPVIVSESVYQQLLVLQPCVRLHEHSIAPIQPTLRICSEVDGTTFQFTPGAHSPGAAMVSITTSSGDRLVYPGDYCLKNRYYTESPDHLTSMFDGTTGRKFLLVDGTFLKHGPTIPKTPPDFEQVISDVRLANQTALFVADSADYLFAAYIWYFQTFYTGPKHNINRHLVAHEDVVTLIETTFEAFIRRRHEDYDPFLKRTLGTAMSNYLESVRLYPFSNSAWPSGLDGAVDVFCPMAGMRTALPHLRNPYALV